MPTSEDYKQMANRSAQLAIACSAPSVAQALLALGLEYMALAARLGQAAEMQQDPAGWARHNRLGMPRSRIEIYWKKSETAPEGVIAQVRVTDGCGSDYLLPYPCKLTKDGWVNAASGKLLAVRPTYWKLYVQTLSRKKPRERSPQLNPRQAERD
jgi:hypothetical protein